MTTAQSPELLNQIAVYSRLDLLSTNEKFAYAAGLFDGEGCVMITKTLNGHYSAVAKVAMTTKEPLFLLQELFGGSIAVRPVKGRRKLQWDWSVYGRELERFLEAILPSLLVKFFQATLTLVLIASLKYTTGTGKRVPVYIVELREFLRLECKADKHLVEQP